MTWELNQAAIRGDFLMHHGVKGQRRGRRRYQNEDGSLTPEGREHYGVGEGGNNKLEKKYNRDIKNLQKLDNRANIRFQKERADKYDKRAKTAAKVGVSLVAGGAGTALGLTSLQSMVGKKISRNKDHFNGIGSKDPSNYRVLYDANWNKLSGKKRLSDASKFDEIYYQYGNHNKDPYYGPRERFDRNEATNKIGRGIGASLAAAGLGAFAVAGVSKAKAHAARKRATPEGHAKAVAQRTAKFNEMQKTYAGTPYADLLKAQNKIIKKNR